MGTSLKAGTEVRHGQQAIGKTFQIMAKNIQPYVHKYEDLILVQMHTHINIYVAGQQSRGNYHAVTVGPALPLVVLLHDRGWPD